MHIFCNKNTYMNSKLVHNEKLSFEQCIYLCNMYVKNVPTCLMRNDNFWVVFDFLLTLLSTNRPSTFSTPKQAKNIHALKSVHFKKPVARISFLSKLWYILSLQIKTKSTTILNETRFA